MAETSVFTVMKCSDSMESVLCFICELIRFGHDHFYMACCYEKFNCRFSLLCIHNKDTEMINMKVDKRKRLLFLLLFSVQIRWREFCLPLMMCIYTDSFKGQQAKLSGRTYYMEMPNVVAGEYSDFYIYHLVMYIF